MLSVDEAQARIVATARLTATEEVPLAAADGRVPAAGWVVAGVDVPPFANSAMDGFALRSADAPGRLRLVGEVAAGAANLPLVEPGSATRIMTGAPLPPGADAVVPIEEAQAEDGMVTVPAVAAGRYVRAAGHDTALGTRVEIARAPLSPATLAVLASLGIGRVEVRRRPRVALLSTGDELVEPGVALGPGQIHDANGTALAAAVAEAGGVARTLPAVGDDPQAIAARLREASADADLLVVSGGVSVGGRDHLRAVIAELGTLDFWRIAVQPGKPLAFGAVGSVPLLGLPGNPVSALVTFELFARPLIRAQLGLAGDGRLHLRARCVETIEKDPPRRAYLRVRVEAAADGWTARSAGGQGSAQLRALADANALLVVPEGEPAAAAGSDYDAILIGEL